MQELAAKLAAQSNRQRQGLGVVTSADPTGTAGNGQSDTASPPPASRSATCVGSTSVVRNNGNHTAVHIHHDHVHSTNANERNGAGTGTGTGTGNGDSGNANGISSGTGNDNTLPSRNARPRHLQVLADRLEHRSCRKRTRADAERQLQEDAAAAAAAPAQVAADGADIGAGQQEAAGAAAQPASSPEVSAPPDTSANTSSRGDELAAGALGAPEAELDA